MKFENIYEMIGFGIYADLDTFDVFILLNDKEKLDAAMTAAQSGFDEWYEDDDPGDTLLERIESKLEEAEIIYEVITRSFDREYMEDLEEENENLSEHNRMLIERIKEMERKEDEND